MTIQPNHGPLADVTNPIVTGKRALVNPRVIAPQSSLALPLAGEVAAFAEANRQGRIEVIGLAGSGKTTALEHLAAVLPAERCVLLLDEPDEGESIPTDRLVVYTARVPRRESHLATYRLAPWTDDELIEYLLAAHKEQCAAVLARIQPEDRLLLQGIPELWTIVLDQLATDESIRDVQSAIRRYLTTQTPGSQLLDRARHWCLNASIGEMAGSDFEPNLVRLLRHAMVQILLATERIAADLHRHGRCRYLAKRLPRELVRSVAAEISGDEHALARLKKLVAGGSRCQAMAASIVHALDNRLVPSIASVKRLAGAYLESAHWPGVKLRRADLREVDLSVSDLRGAKLDYAAATNAHLKGIHLNEACMFGFQAKGADLSDADLSSVRAEKASFDEANLQGARFENAVMPRASFVGANLTAACLRGADLSGATFADVNLQDVDFSLANFEAAILRQLRLHQATLTGARFPKASLQACDLEYLELPNANFDHANLQGALLTGTTMKDVNFANALLRDTALGDIDWEGACLRNADLRGATFHMGSTRSGLLFTPIASEGTRTGFYSDDYDERYFKDPEEIRKANLRGADLRGANIEGVDFYLVDLRDALYDSRQEEHFRRCGAILEARDYPPAQ